MFLYVHREYDADQYVCVADPTKSLSIKDYPGVTLVKRYFNIPDNNGVTSWKKIAPLKEFQKIVSYLKRNPYIQLIEYIGDEYVYRPRPHGNCKDYKKASRLLAQLRTRQTY